MGARLPAEGGGQPRAAEVHAGGRRADQGAQPAHRAHGQDGLGEEGRARERGDGDAGRADHAGQDGGRLPAAAPRAAEPAAAVGGGHRGDEAPGPGHSAGLGALRGPQARAAREADAAGRAGPLPGERGSEQQGAGHEHLDERAGGREAARGAQRQERQGERPHRGGGGPEKHAREDPQPAGQRADVGEEPPDRAGEQAGQAEGSGGQVQEDPGQPTKRDRAAADPGRAQRPLPEAARGRGAEAQGRQEAGRCPEGRDVQGRAAALHPAHQGAGPDRGDRGGPEPEQEYDLQGEPARRLHHQAAADAVQRVLQRAAAGAEGRPRGRREERRGDAGAEPEDSEAQQDS